MGSRPEATCEKHINLNCKQRMQINLLLNPEYAYLKFSHQVYSMQVGVSQKFIYQLVCG